MQTGDLVMFRGSGFIPWMIRTWTRSAWGHCGVLLVIEGIPMVLEARFGQGVSLHALANRTADEPDIYPTGRAVDVALALAHAGDLYSAKDALLAAIDEAGHHAGWECAELAAWLLGMDHDAKGWTPQGLISALVIK